MELLIIPKESKMLISSFVYGSDPSINASIILSELLEGSPVLLSIVTKLNPDGTLKGVLFSLVLAFFIKSLNIGTATDEPVCLYPRLFGLSWPTKTPTTKSGE